MGKLHELLAVEPDLRTGAEAALAKVRAFFNSDKMLGFARVYQPLEEGGDERPPETKNVEQTVLGELRELARVFGRYVDASLEKEITNRITSADVVVDGQLFLQDVPTPALLNLRGRLEELRKVIAKAPVYDTAQKWTHSGDRGLWESDPETRYSTAKAVRSLVLYEATKEHPAQVQTYTEDVRVGKWQITNYCGSLSPVQHAEILERLDRLIMAVKRAQIRANDVDVVQTKAADKIFTYILGE